ncbi:MAG: DUF1684 domain-containing protein [Bacteroidetes bacterium]|nr:DUF1684 domain-containing protein [Bacteroidota bacterium]
MRKRYLNQNIILIILIPIIFLMESCGRSYSPEQKKYIEDIEKFRKEKNDYMKNSKDSPFNQDKNAVFHPLKYFDVNPDFVFKSKLYRNTIPDTITIFGTKGEARKAIRFGYVKFSYENKNYKLNVYKGTTKNGTDYYTIWFTDKTTGEETYGVGRYLDFDLIADTAYVYTVDFNLAYNPYCSYSAKYSCAIPSKEDHLDIALEAGEKNFH